VRSRPERVDDAPEDAHRKLDRQFGRTG
jgi:hypothetical protein